MPRPTKEQLRKINKFSQVELKEEQVYVFTSLSVDTLPIKRQGWFGEYTINMTERMLNKLKRDYRQGVGLLASHNTNRLPFGRTFDAEVRVDEVDGEQVKTLYIDHYIVTHVEDEEGNKIPLRTEINGMTTQDIVNHIEVGHTFDTSIGFSMDEIKCSICKNDLRDWEKCKHIPGMYYDVQVGEETQRQRCDIIVDYGEGIENSLVYAGAVDRAIIQNVKPQTNESLSAFSQNYDSTVKFGDTPLYNVDELKNLPKDAKILCFLSKGNMQVFTNTPERRDYKQYLENKEREEMDAKTHDTPEVTVSAVTEEQFAQLQAEKEDLEDKLAKAEDELANMSSKVLELQEELKAKDAQIEELSVKAQLADEYRNDLIEQTIQAGIAARGNAFNVERYRKYVSTLSVEEIKEELSAFKQEFPGTVEAARVTAVEAETERVEELNTEITLHEIRQEAARLAMQEFQKNGGDLQELTEKHYDELRKKYNK